MALITRAFAPGDWRILKAIRLKALQTDPAVFGSYYQKESAYDEITWRSWLTSPDTIIFALFDEGAAIGMTGIAMDSGDPARQRAVIWGSWLEPDYRGRQLSAALYEACIGWARQHATCRTVIVSHRAENIVSKKANQKHGFVFTHETARTWPDGETEGELFYELAVKPVT